jgi:putative transposase
MILTASLLALLFAPPAPEAEIRAVLDKQQADWNRGDVVAFMSGYEESPAITFQGKALARGFAAVLERYKKKPDGNRDSQQCPGFRSTEIGGARGTLIFRMPRYARIVVPGCAHHLTQRGNHREPVFGSDDDYEVYLDLVAENARQCEVALLGYTLMPNHVHWIATPCDEDALAAAFGRAHYRYSHYFQTKNRTSGHLWQNRFYSCPLGRDHLVRAMRYVELNPVRAGMVRCAPDHAWSSARAHVEDRDQGGMLDLAAWRAVCGADEWRGLLAAEETDGGREIERCTYGGRPYGGEEFRREVGLRAGRDLALGGSGRPRRRMEMVATKPGHC